MKADTALPPATRSSETSLRLGSRHWLVLANCQAEGLANCLEVLVPGLRVQRIEVLRAGNELAEIVEQADQFERVIISSRVRDIVGAAVERFQDVTWIPNIWFQGYHPDLCYLSSVGPLSRGPLGNYHSAICWSAFKCGRSEAQTVSLFNSRTYEALGYFDIWPSARDDFLRAWAAYGVDMRTNFVRWARRGPFMHTPNHPHILTLLDVAREVLRSMGAVPRETRLVPQDNLARGPVFPVYPEVGAKLGVQGSYYFKAGGGYSVCALDEFVARSFAVYRSAGDQMPDQPTFLPTLQKVRAYIETVT